MMALAVVAAPTATAAFARKLHAPGVINSRQTKHSPQGQRFRRPWCGSGRSGGGGVGGGGGGGGGDARRSRRWLLVLCGDGSDSNQLLPPKTVSWENLFRPVATQHISWEVLFTHRNELLDDPLEPSHPQNTSWELVSTLRNEQRPRLKSLSALGSSTPMERIEFFKNSWRIQFDFFYFLIFYFGYAKT